MNSDDDDKNKTGLLVGLGAFAFVVGVFLYFVVRN